MKKVYKNELHRIIKEDFGLDTNRFTVKDLMHADRPLLNLSIIDSKLEFEFLNTNASWDDFKFRYSLFTPDYRWTDWHPDGNALANWQGTCLTFKGWLSKHVKPFFEEIEGVDKWNSFQLERNIFQLTQASIDDNIQFNFEESTVIMQAIENLRQLISDKYDLTEEQLAFVSHRLDYLSDATGRMNKFDWSNLMVSIVISIAINMAIDTDTGKEFYELVNAAFANVKLLFLK